MRTRSEALKSHRLSPEEAAGREPKLQQSKELSGAADVTVFESRRKTAMYSPPQDANYTPTRDRVDYRAGWGRTLRRGIAGSSLIGLIRQEGDGRNKRSWSELCLGKKKKKDDAKL